MASGRAAPGFRPEKIGTKPCTSLTQTIYPNTNRFYKTKGNHQRKSASSAGINPLNELRTSNFDLRKKKDLLSF